MDVEAEVALQKARSEAEYNQYLAKTPELRQLITDFTTSCLTVKPDDVRAYAVHYFSKMLPSEDELATGAKQASSLSKT